MLLWGCCRNKSLALGIVVILLGINREFVVGLFRTQRKGGSMNVNYCEQVTDVVNMLQMFWKCCRLVAERTVSISTTSSKQVHCCYSLVTDLL